MEKNILITADELAVYVARHIDALEKANKRLAFSVFCLSAAGYLTWRCIHKQTLRINELEQKLESLVKPEEPASE